jgi:antitoxin component YwqK of YwqJK toxin-antitoxin module
MKMICILMLFFFGINSQAQTEYNKLDDKGNKNGLWKGFYEESKRPRYEGTFNHGKEVGVFTYFDDTKAKSIIATRKFSKTDNSAYTIFYDQNKNIVSEGKVIGKLREGIWKYYHQNSKVLMTQELYKNGNLEGLRSVYYPSGKIAEETNYKNNSKEGFYKKYAEIGFLLEESNYKKGEFHGQAIYKDPDGNIVAKGLYKEGKKVGIWQFFINGKFDHEENMSFRKNKIKNKK